MPSCPIIDVRQIPTHVHISHLKLVFESCDVDCFTYENKYKSKKKSPFGDIDSFRFEGNPSSCISFIRNLGGLVLNHIYRQDQYSY